MAINHISAVFDAHIPNPTDKLVALAVADFADRDTGSAWPALATLQSMTSLCERSVRNALRRLESDGHLTSKASVGRGNTACYWLHPKDEFGRPVLVKKGAADAPLSPEKGAPPAPIDPTKGAADAPIPDLKGASGSIKGASGSIKGAADAPKPLRTVKNQSTLPKPAALPTLDEVLIFTRSLGLPDTDGESCFWKWQANGWTNSGKPIGDWQATILSWKAAGYLASQKSTSPGSKPARNPEKKEARAPEELGRLMAIHREQYPQSRVERWQDIPADIRREAEAVLAAEKKAAPATPSLT